MGSIEPAYSIEYDAQGNVSKVFIDGQEATLYGDNPPPGEKNVVATEGEPDEAKGIEVADVAASRCVHYFCQWWCI